MTKMSEETVAVYAASSRARAEIVRSTLEAEGIAATLNEPVIDVFLRKYAVGELLFWGEVRVNARDAENAKALLADYEPGPGRSAVDEVELAWQAESASDPEV